MPSRVWLFLTGLLMLAMAWHEVMDRVHWRDLDDVTRPVVLFFKGASLR